MAPSPSIGAHVRRATEASDPRGGDGGRITLQINLKGRANKHIAGIEPGNLAEGAIRAQRAIGTGEVNVRAGADIVVHPDLRSERVDLLHPAGLDRRNQCRVRIERKAGSHLALQSQPLAICWQQKFNRSRVEPDTVVQPLDAIGCVNAFDRQHGGENLALGNRAWVAREQRFDKERLVRLHHEVHAIAGNVDPWHLVHNLVDLRDDHAIFEGGCLNDRRRIFRVGSGIEIAVPVRADRRDQGDMRRQVDEVAGEQLQIGVNRPQLDFATEQHPGDARRLRTRVRVVQPFRHAGLEHIQVFGKDHT